MPGVIDCFGCGAAVSVPDTPGVKFRCPRCKVVLTTGEAAPAEPPMALPVPEPLPADDPLELTTAEPAAPRKRRRRDDEDEAEETTDEDDRPTRAGAPKWLIPAALGVALVTGAIGAALAYAFTRAPEAAADNKPAPAAPTQPAPKPDNKPVEPKPKPPNPEPKVTPKTNPGPAPVPLPEGLPPEVWARVKGALTQVSLSDDTGLVGTATGFFVRHDRVMTWAGIRPPAEPGQALPPLKGRQRHALDPADPARNTSSAPQQTGRLYGNAHLFAVTPLERKPGLAFAPEPPSTGDFVYAVGYAGSPPAPRAVRTKVRTYPGSGPDGSYTVYEVDFAAPEGWQLGGPVIDARGRVVGLLKPPYRHFRGDIILGKSFRGQLAHDWELDDDGVAAWAREYKHANRFAPNRPRPDSIPDTRTLAAYPVPPVEIDLGGKPADACTGRGGSYHILHVPARNELVVIDLAQMNVAGRIPVEGERVAFAAGQSDLFVAAGSDTLRRYDLKTLEKKPDVRLPVGAVRQLAMGAGSNGPLLVQHGSTPGRYAFSLIDLATLKPIPMPKGPAVEFGFHVDCDEKDDARVRANADGSLFTMYATNRDKGGGRGLRLTGGTPALVFTEEHPSVRPAWDGTTYFTERGPYTTFGTPYPTVSLLPERPPFPPAVPPKKAEEEPKFNAVPAQTGPLFITLNWVPKRDGGFGPLVDPSGTHTPVYLWAVGASRPLAHLGDVPAGSIDPRGTDPLTYDKRVVFAPEFGRLAVVRANAPEKVRVHRVDIDDVLDVANVYYLYADSRPPAAVPGRPFDYTPATQTVPPTAKRPRPQGKVTVALTKGPRGMQVIDGRVTWPVPADFRGPEPVVLTIRDESGLTATHAFDLYAAPADAK